MRESIIQWIKNYYTSNVDGVVTFDERMYEAQSIYWCLGMLAALIFASVVTWFLARLVMLQVLHVLVDRTKTNWDDYLVKNKFFRALAHLVPLMFMDYFLTIVFYKYPVILNYSDKLVLMLILIATIVAINRFLSAVRDIMTENDKYRDKPIQSYFQVIKIVNAGVFIIVILSVMTDRSPLFFLTSLGAVSAVTLLVFRDTILGFVGSLQLSANDMIRIGDWVTMEKYGADGDVEEINLATVKVRNFDKTITTIPTYSFISDSFKNWRGMEESDGRRIKRSIRINIDTVKFADDELIDSISKLKLLKEFVKQRQQEIKEYNESHGFVGEEALNGRRQTNIGLFRRYIEYYLSQSEHINKNMTLMVRQLEATELGVPIEVYCFTKTKVWEEYELIISDLFDHLFAVIPIFGLQVFEVPTGRDMRAISRSTK